MREWVELFDEPRPFTFWLSSTYLYLSVYRVVDFVPREKRPVAQVSE